jgi:hypothetical protein
MVGSAKDLLFHPDIFFAKVSKEKAGFTWPVVIVALGSIVSFAGAVVLSPAATDPLIQYSITFLSLFAVAVDTWVIISTILFLLSRAFSGTGSYLITLQNTGYGMLPLAFSNAITLVSVAAITGNFAILSSIPPLFFSALVYGEQLIFTIWAAWLWICGIRNAHSLPVPLAIAIVVIMIAASLAIFIVLTAMLFH